jgi:hypothetical protein
MSVSAFVCWAVMVSGAPPSNDDFARRGELTGSEGQLEATNREATGEASDPPLPELSGRSVWWRWTPLRDGRATIHALGSSFDTLLAVYTTDGDVLTQVAFNDDSPEHESYQSVVTFQAVLGREHAVRVDGFEGETGAIVLTWHLDGSAPPPPGDAFADRTQLEGARGRLFASNRLATREAGEPAHFENASGRTLWYRWLAPGEGTLTLHTQGSAVDSVIAAYSGEAIDRLTAIARDDDSGRDYASWLTLDVEPGADPAVALDSLGEEGGLLVLEWLFEPRCGPPAPAAAPTPADGAAGTVRNPVLRWGAAAVPAGRTIYGPDDRLEVHEVDDPVIVEAWRSTAALMVVPRDLQDLGDGHYALNPLTYGEAAALCPDERFAEQPAPATCTAFLAAPDLIVTAGHCVGEGMACDELAFVFGFGMTKPGEIPLRLPTSQVYRCAGVIAAVTGAGEDEKQDWAVIRLDRAVTDRQPLRLRREGKIANGQEVIVIGHPGGLPAKVAGGARARDNSPASTFLANLDTFGGNSGSPVLSFNAGTPLVEGILVAGEEDFVADGSCYREKRCPDDGCLGEAVVRATTFDHWIPPARDVVHEVHLGPCGALALVGTTSDTAFEVGLLEPSATYCWQVVSRGECGVQKGPVWTFTTGASVALAFRRGDATGDARHDITDAIVALGYLFLGAAAPACLSSADADDSGTVEVTDAIYLLQHLFNGGPAPPWPFPACGHDPTTDALGCGAAAACSAE